MYLQNLKSGLNPPWKNKKKAVKDRTRLESVYCITAFFAVLRSLTEASSYTLQDVIKDFTDT
jgi:hypothetical protein